MSYSATVFPVMIASPSDVSEERACVQEVVLQWSMQNSATDNLVLLPVTWEFHAAPDLSGRPQELINSRLLKKCDLLIGIFWARLGTPTGEHESGTVEEIKTHVADGKPAMIYFSKKLIAIDEIVDEQKNNVKEFKKWCHTKGLVSEFSSTGELRGKLERDIRNILKDSPYFVKLLDDASIVETREPNKNSVELSEVAAKMLVEAATGNGVVTAFRSIDGTHFQAGDYSFENDGTRREVAKLESALEELMDLGLLKPVGHKGEVFEVTSRGFQAVDQRNT